MRMDLNSPKRFEVFLGLQYLLVLVLQILLAWLTAFRVVNLNNRVVTTIVVVAAILFFIIGAAAINKSKVRTAFCGELVALVPLVTGLTVLLGGNRCFFQASIVLAIGIAIATVIVAIKPDLFDGKDKAKSLIPIVAIIVLVELIGFFCKWLQFDIIRPIVVFICAVLYADCWHRAVIFNPRNKLGLVDGGTQIIRAPIEKIKKFASGLKEIHLYDRFKDWVNGKTS